eukprot:6200774-Pleurochrysis_carterae.AAC.1
MGPFCVTKDFCETRLVTFRVLIECCVITRGKTAERGPSAKLSVADTAWLWGARLPGVTAERMRHVPYVTAAR